MDNPSFGRGRTLLDLKLTLTSRLGFQINHKGNVEMERETHADVDGPVCRVDQSCCNSAEPKPADKLETQCTLNPAEMPDRVARWRALFGKVMSHSEASGSAVFVFPQDPSVARELAELVKLERVCCAHVSWELEQTSDALIVTLSAESSALDTLVKGFLPEVTL